MISRNILFLAIPPLALCACSVSGSDGEDAADNIRISSDGEESKFSIKTDDFALDVDLPAMMLDSESFNLNNVHLYPGTKVASMKIEDRDDKGGRVVMKFIAPASIDKLASWFEQKMTEEKFTFTHSSGLFSGKTEEGDPFSLKLKEISSDETRGTLEFSEDK